MTEPDEEKVKEMEAKMDVEGLINVLKYNGKWNAGIGDAKTTAAKALGEIRDTRAVEPLIQALQDAYFDEDFFWETGEMESFSPWVRNAAAEALGKIGDARAVEPLIKALKSETVRVNAAEALGNIGDIRAVEPLIKTLKDKDQFFRRKAVEALGKIGDARAVEPLSKAALKDRDRHVQKLAQKALNKIKVKKS